MVSKHRAGVVARALRLRSPKVKAVVPAPCRPGIELVDAQGGVKHRMTPDELLTGRARGNYEAFCGQRLLAASLTDPGRGRCPGGAS